MHKVYYKFQDKSNNEEKFKITIADGSQEPTIDNLYSFTYNDVEYTHNQVTHDSTDSSIALTGREYADAEGNIVRFRRNSAFTPFDGYWQLIGETVLETIAPCRDCLLENISTGFFSEFEMNPVTEQETGGIVLEDNAWVASSNTQIVTAPSTNPTDVDTIAEITVETPRGNWIHGVRAVSNKDSIIEEFTQKSVYDRADIILYIGKEFSPHTGLDIDIFSVSEDGVLSPKTDMSKLADIKMTVGQNIFEDIILTDNFIEVEHFWRQDSSFNDKWTKKSHRAIIFAQHIFYKSFVELLENPYNKSFAEGILEKIDEFVAELLNQNIQARLGAVILNLEDNVNSIENIRDFIEDVRNFSVLEKLPFILTKHKDDAETYESIKLELENIALVESDDLEKYQISNILPKQANQELALYTNDGGYKKVPLLDIQNPNPLPIEVTGLPFEWQCDLGTSNKEADGIISKIAIRMSGILGYTYYLNSTKPEEQMEYLQTNYGKIALNEKYEADWNVKDENGDCQDLNLSWENVIQINDLGELYHINEYGQIIKIAVLNLENVPEEKVGSLTIQGEEQLAHRWVNASLPFVLKKRYLTELSPTAHYSASEGVTTIGDKVTRWSNLSEYGTEYDFYDRVARYQKEYSAARPSLKTFGIGGMPTIVFNPDKSQYEQGSLDIANQHLINYGNPLVESAKNKNNSKAHGATDIFVVMESYLHYIDRSDAEDYQRGSLFHILPGYNSGQHARIVVHAPWGDNNFYAYHRQDARAFTQTKEAVEDQVPYILNIRSEDANILQIWKNGYEVASQNHAETAITDGASHFLLAKAGHYQSCGIAELVIFKNILNSTDRQFVEGYLAHKYGLAGSLPNNHIYKTTKP